VVEEADETMFGLELPIETGVVSEARVTRLLNEANELVRIFSASQRTARRRK